MRIDRYGIPIYSSRDLEQLLYQGNTALLDEILADPEDPEIQRYNKTAQSLDEPTIPLYQNLDIELSVFDQSLQNTWLMPREYQEFDIEGFLANQCPKEHYQRMIDELAEFRARNMLDLLRWMKYFVDTCRNKGVVWGVGRGSSVASYVLYLIGVHKIDPVKYKLDWRDFLR
jgi:DNA polymerase III alpha subunit